MLTLKQPTTYGYRSVHDLPTPPSASRPSPPLNYSEAAYKPRGPVSGSHSPTNQVMSAPHRGLPPPAAMALPPQQPPPAAVPPAQHHGHQQQLSQGPPAQTGLTWSTLPPPPQQWQGAEESMRNWLQAKTEEEKTKQEEEKTRQESLRLEQRRIEMDMLRASLGGGVPPPMVPLVFAGMGSGGTLPQAALDWAQQFFPPSQSQHLQLLPAQRQHSPEPHQREATAPAQSQYAGSAVHAVPPPGPGGYGPYPGSPMRPRGQTVSGAIGQPSTAPMPSYPPQSSSHMHTQSASQDSSPSIFFHHWQPPASQAGSSSSNRPGTPSGESARKRKAPGPYPSGQTPGEQRLRSPPPFIQSSLSNPPHGRKGGHKRQKSDVSWLQHSSHHRDDSERASRPLTPTRDTNAEFSQSRYGTDPSKHSVSTLLSHERSGAQLHESVRPDLRRSHDHDPDRPIPRQARNEEMPRDRYSPARGSESV